MTRAVDDPILSVEHLSMRFGGIVAVGDLSFVAQRGHITALIGPNGAGKTGPPSACFACVTPTARRSCSNVFSTFGSPSMPRSRGPSRISGCSPP